MAESTNILSRREFLKRFTAGIGCFAVTAAGCGRFSSRRPAHAHQRRRHYSFPQGVASADPQPDAVMLWTRVVSESGMENIHLKLQLAESPDFSLVLVEEALLAAAEADHTVRVFVDGLAADRTYYYRFVAPDGATSEIGRTWTAPAPEANRGLNIAVFSCQMFYTGFSSAYRSLINEDAAASKDRKIDLVLHLGDLIYEAAISGWPDLNGNPIHLTYKDARERGFRELPSGGVRDERGWPIAATLDDYRFLYQAMLSDSDMKAARALFPFVYTWDDHEVVNDIWQSYSSLGWFQKRKVVASQAWFEYVPAVLDQAAIGPAGESDAHGFRRTAVEDAPATRFDDHYLSLEPNNLAATKAMTTYRYLRWGKLADVLILDERSYRGPRGVPVDMLNLAAGSPYPSAPLPAEFVRFMNEGRAANGEHPPATLELQGVSVPNVRRDAPTGSMLGRRQKEWLKTSLARSQAKWKVLCNSVPMMRFGFDTAFREHGTRDGLLWTDHWDGYPAERDELTRFMASRGITNVVSLTGDRHAHFAGYVLNDFDGEAGERIFPEFAGASVSSGCQMCGTARSLKGDSELVALVHFDGRPHGYKNAMTPALNAWLLYGAACAKKLSELGDEAAAIAEAAPYANPHLEYADTDAHGYYVVRLNTDALEAEFVTIPEPIVDHGEPGPPLRRRITFALTAWSSGETPRLSLRRVEGEPPVLGVRSWPPYPIPKVGK